VVSRSLETLIASALLACGACSVEPTVENVPLLLRELESCALHAPSAVELLALGDFPSRPAQLRAGPGSSVFDQFPRDTRELLVRATTDEGLAQGRRLLAHSTGDQPVLVLPSGRSCPLGDPLARALPGAALAALPSGGLLIAGGRAEDDSVRTDVVTLAPGASLVEQVPGGMLFRRTYASATVVGPLVVIAGGTGDLRGTAQETYEVFDSEAASFVASRSRKLVTGPRMEHAALLLRDGRVLIVGGRADASEPSPLSSAELLDIALPASDAISGEAGLNQARTRPYLLELDSGSVIVLGGRDAALAVVPSVERYDVARSRFMPVSLLLPTHSEVVAAALPGARVAWLGCDSGAFAQCELTLLMERDGDFISEEVALDFASQAPSGLSELRLLALDNGQLLLTASDASDARQSRRAFVIDLNAPKLSAVDASRVAKATLMLRSGVVVELDELGASLREPGSLSEYESPAGNLVAEESQLLTLSAASHWQRTAEGLMARVEGARVDVPRLRFGAFQIELDASGNLSLLLFDRTAKEVAVELVDGAVQLAGCRRQLLDGSKLLVTGNHTQLLVRNDAGDNLCTQALSADSLRVAVRASANSVLRGLSVRRQ
jgi:hypothetical protein